MPEEFDPAWEYWEPDPEVAEAMCGRQVSDRELFYESFPVPVDRRGASGFRLSRLTMGHLAWIPSKLGRSRKRPAPDRCRTRKSYECLKCGSEFSVTRSRLYYCVDCLPGSGSVKGPITVLVCGHCGCDYPRRWPGQRFCSVSCGTLNRTIVRTDVPDDSGWCRECGTSIPPSRATNGIPRWYCDRKCAQKSRNRKNNAKRVRKSSRLSPVTSSSCTD